MIKTTLFEWSISLEIYVHHFHVWYFIIFVGRTLFLGRWNSSRGIKHFLPHSTHHSYLGK